MNDGPPPTLFFPSSANYMTDFLATMFNVTQLIRKQSPMSKRQMVAIIFDSGESSDGQTMQMSQIGNLTAALDAGQCTVSGSPFFESSSKVVCSVKYITNRKCYSSFQEIWIQPKLDDKLILIVITKN